MKSSLKEANVNVGPLQSQNPRKKRLLVINTERKRSCRSHFLSLLLHKFGSANLIFLNNRDYTYTQTTHTHTHTHKQKKSADGYPLKYL